MRQLIVFSDVSLDGFMAGPNNDLDFMADDSKLADEFTAELRAVADTIIFGRKSFEPSAAYWTAADGDLADWMNSTPKLILSSNQDLDTSAWANTTVADLDRIRQLKESAGQAIVAFGGVHTLQALISAGLVDQYWLKINPAVVGHGGSMFSELTDRRRLTLRSAKPYPSGTIAAIYSA